jgi:hypothetical protein
MNTESRDLKNALLRAGCGQYLDALSSLNHFTLEVTKICVDVLNQKIDPLLSALQVIDQPKPIAAPYCNPGSLLDQKWDGHWAWLAARLDLPQIPKTIFYGGLTFERGEQGEYWPCINFMIKSPNKAQFGIIKETFSKSVNIRNEFDFWPADEYNECGFRKKLLNSNNIEDELSAVADFTIDICKKLKIWSPQG